MAEVHPFRGIRYNQETVKDLTRVVCPPYDVITPEQQKLYYKKSDYNAIRLEYPLTCHCERSEAISNDKYGRAATVFEQWLKQGALQVDDHAAFYLHDHHFTHLGKRRRRRGLIARVKLGPWGDSVYPHEETFSKAKRDRLQLMRSCQANFSPLFALYQDSEHKIASILREASQGKPIIDIAVPSPLKGEGQGMERRPSAEPPLFGKGREGEERHVVWAITDSGFQRQIERSLSGQPLYMADGHHRYETALVYQRERARSAEACPRQRAGGKPPRYNYVMMELVDFSDLGLVVLPIHRLVRGISLSTLARLRKRFENLFTLEFIPLTESLLATRHCERSEAIPKMIGEAVLGVLGLEPGCLVFLKQRQGVSLGAMMPSNRSQAYKEFNVSLLNHVILDKMLSLAPSSEDIAYTVDTTDAYQQVREGKYQLAFLLTSPSLKVLKIVVDAKDRMPRKSTYFHPKLPAGLIINSLE